MWNSLCIFTRMLRPLALVFALSLLAAPALAQSTTESLEARQAVHAESSAFDVDVALGEVEQSVPAYGIAAPLFAAQLSASAESRWFNRSWASVEMAIGTMGSAYAAWVLSSIDENEHGYASASTSMALAINLRLVSHGALSWALYSDGEDVRAARLVPSVSVLPTITRTERGATVTARWAF
jgi:hypothetical protein